MQNWSTDEKHLKKHPKKYAIWKLEQMVNFGLGGEKIKKADLKKYWSQLHLDPAKQSFLSLLLHGKNFDRSSNRAAKSHR